MSRVVAKHQNYEKVLPFATYTPYLSDTLFNKTYDMIKQNTLVDISGLSPLPKREQKEIGKKLDDFFEGKIKRKNL